MSSREFNQDVSRAKEAARRRPLIITDRGRPVFVLLRYDAYRKLAAATSTAASRLADPESAHIDFDPPKIGEELPSPAAL